MSNTLGIYLDTNTFNSNSRSLNYLGSMRFLVGFLQRAQTWAIAGVVHLN